MSETEQRREDFPIEAYLEGILFVASEPVSINQLAEALDKSSAAVELGLKKLEDLYQNRGFSLQRHAGKVQITTSANIAQQVQKFLGIEASAKLSRAALECLAIISYRQPVTHPGIDDIRGVNSDGVLKSLLSKGLIQEVGRAEGPGRPILYGTTSEFLQHFGLSSLDELPPFETVEPKEQPAQTNGILKD